MGHNFVILCDNAAFCKIVCIMLCKLVFVQIVLDLFGLKTIFYFSKLLLFGFYVSN